MQIKDISKLLKDSGLSDRQSSVYAAALALGTDTVQHIAEQSGVKRATTYLVIDELKDMGLLTETKKGKKTLIYAEPPVTIKEFLISQEEKITRQKENLDNSLEMLESIGPGKSADAPKIRYFIGSETAFKMDSYLNRKTSKEEIVYSYTDTDEIRRLMPAMLEKGTARRRKKGYTLKVLHTGKLYGDPDTDSGLQAIELDDKARGSIQIYNDRMTLMSHEGEQSVGIIIEGKTVVGAVRHLYEMAWEGQELKKKAAEYKNK